MKLSIIIPVYNVEKYIRKCLDSVIMIPLDKSDYEIIVVNDGTQDNSMKVVEEYEKYSNIHVINQSNKGLGGARNNGLKNAVGEWVYFIDSDDYFDATLFSKLFLKANIKQDVDIIIGNYNYVHQDVVKKSRKAIRTSDDIVQEGSLFFRKYYPSISTMVWRSIYRRNFLIENSFFFTEGIFHEDVNWTPKCIALANKVYYSPIPFYYYIIREGSIVQSVKTEKKINDMLFAFKDLLNYFSFLDSELQKAMSETVTENLLVLNGQYSIFRDSIKYYNWRKLLLTPCSHNLKTELLIMLYRLLAPIVNRILENRYSNNKRQNLF